MPIAKPQAHIDSPGMPASGPQPQRLVPFRYWDSLGDVADARCPFGPTADAWTFAMNLALRGENRAGVVALVVHGVYRLHSTVPRQRGEKGTRCNAAAAPATVSGEASLEAPLGCPGKADEAASREPGDLPSHDSLWKLPVGRRGVHRCRSKFNGQFQHSCWTASLLCSLPPSLGSHWSSCPALRRRPSSTTPLTTGATPTISPAIRGHQ
jgi:hypothetical protein